MLTLDEHSPRLGPDQILPSSLLKTSNAEDIVTINISKDGYGSQKPISIYTMLKMTADEHSMHPAMAVKRNGEWNYWSYKEYFEGSRIVAKALIKLGLERFHGVCIMGFNSPEWSVASIGAIFAGGLSTGIYTTNSADACRHVAENCEAQIIFVEDDVYLEKILSIKHLLPHLKVIVQWIGNPKVRGVISWAELIAIGEQELDEALDERLSLSAVNQCCSLIYTSGTTGPPKGVMVSQDNLTWVTGLYQAIAGVPVEEKDKPVGISYLPFSHIAGQVVDIYGPVRRAGTIYFAQPDALKGSLGQTLNEVEPTGFFAVPRIWEKIYEKLQAATGGGLQKIIADWATYHGTNEYNAFKEGRELGRLDKIKASVAKTILINKVKSAIGMRRVERVASGAAPISMHILEYFMSLGLPIMESYGMSEGTGVCSFSFYKPGNFRLGSVGKVIPFAESQIVKSGDHGDGVGEICMRGRNICMGYLKMPQKVDEAIDDDGWLHTGDLGRFDEDGFLYITGRLKELVITAGGENIPPVLIEDAVKKELFCVSSAMLVGDRRKYLAILLTLKCEVDLDTAMPYDELTPLCIDWMRSIGSDAKTVTQAREEIERNQRCALARAIDAGIQRYNQNHAVSHAQKIQKWTILDHDFSQPTNELNNTLKLKRSHVLQVYKDVIDSMYESGNNNSKL